MIEELKIKISAEISDLKKKMQDAKDEVDKLGKNGKNGFKEFQSAA